MVRIIKMDGTELGITDAPIYIKYGESGDFTPSSVKDAIGVAFQGKPYNLVGHEEIEDTDTVLVSHVDSGEVIKQQVAASVAATEDALCELDAGFEERIGAVETALSDGLPKSHSCSFTSHARNFVQFAKGLQRLGQRFPPPARAGSRPYWPGAWKRALSRLNRLRKSQARLINDSLTNSDNLV